MDLEVKFIRNTVISLGGTKWKYTIICEMMDYLKLGYDILKIYNLYCTVIIENEEITKQIRKYSAT